jgi:hypothetical protein
MADAGEGLNRAGVHVVLWVPLRDRAQPVRWSLLAVGVLAWAGGATVFFRYPLFSSFAVIFGERGDARMIVYFHEHLFNALHGKAQFVSPGFFYPVRDTLGMAPAFLLNLVPYAILRDIGCDPFLAFQLLLVVLSLVCFVASLVIATRYLQVRAWIALCAAGLVTFANNLSIKAGVGHTNFLLLYYVPCIIMFRASSPSRCGLLRIFPGLFLVRLPGLRSPRHCWRSCFRLTSIRPGCSP